MSKFPLLALTLFTLPLCTFAAPAPTDLKSFLGLLTGIINLIVPLIFALTAIAISWGVIKAWVMGDSSEDDIETGKKVALAGVIALTIMISIWGILRLLQTSIFPQ